MKRRWRGMAATAAALLLYIARSTYTRLRHSLPVPAPPRPRRDHPASSAPLPSAQPPSPPTRLRTPPAPIHPSVAAAAAHARGVPPDPIHLAIAADARHLPGVAAAVCSTRRSSGAPHLLRFHLVTLAAMRAAAERTLRCYGVLAAAEAGGAVELLSMPEAWVEGRLRVLADPAVTGSLDSPLNFARFYLAALLPALERVIYLDADVVVQADVRRLWETPLPAGVPAAAVPRQEKHFRYQRYVAKCGELYARRAGRRLVAEAPTFNAGVMLANLSAWREANLTREAEWWLAQHKRSASGLWALGSQPVLHLILHGQWVALPEKWNLDGLGRVSNLSPESLASARLLHWTGRRKPWLQDGLYQKYWRRFVSKELQRQCS